MADPALYGNGEPCPACALRRDTQDTAMVVRPKVPCNHCRGGGRVAVPIEAIIARHVTWAREHYWPAFDRRNAQ